MRREAREHGQGRTYIYDETEQREFPKRKGQ